MTVSSSHCYEIKIYQVQNQETKKNNLFNLDKSLLTHNDYVLFNRYELSAYLVQCCQTCTKYTLNGLVCDSD